MSWFVVYPIMDFGSPISYFRLVSHALGHQTWAHLIGNFSLLLLLGPPLEEKVGSQTLLVMMTATALVTGIINILFFDVALMGASGVLFMLIVLISFVNYNKSKGIPLTFLLVVLFYVGKEVLQSFNVDNISQAAHIIGGFTGAIFGFSNGLLKAKEPQKTLDTENTE